MNDWVLKAAFGSWWTGKLSDVAGLYAFPLLWFAFLPRRRDLIFALTAIGFLLWKSPLSGPPLAAWNSLELWPLTRVVDYTDWLALIALVPAFRSTQQSSQPARSRWSMLGQRVAATGVTAIAAVAFMATSTAPSFNHVFPPGSDYHVDGARPSVRAHFLVHDWESTRANSGVTADTLSGGGLRVSLRDASPCGTLVTLIDMESGDEDEDLMLVQQTFEDEVIAPLQLQFPACTL